MKSRMALRYRLKPGIDVWCIAFQENLITKLLLQKFDMFYCAAVSLMGCGCFGIMGKIILRLDRMMVERKISLNELAERVGISNVNLSKIKNNKVTAIRFSTLAAICEALDCEAGEILEFQKD